MEKVYATICWGPRRKADPPGPLNRAQHALWKRPRGRMVGNALSSVRYWLWRLSR